MCEVRDSSNPTLVGLGVTGSSISRGKAEYKKIKFVNIVTPASSTTGWSARLGMGSKISSLPLCRHWDKDLTIPAPDC